MKQSILNRLLIVLLLLNSVTLGEAGKGRSPARTISTLINVTVLSPNGGQNWLALSQQNITWTSINIENIKIKYTTNNGTSWIDVISSTPAASGTYTWSVPNTPSTKCKIRISDVTNSSIVSISNSAFSIIIPNGLENTSEIPAEFKLSQNFPNPFNPATVINYQLPENSFVSLRVFDMIGNEVATLVNEEKQAGYHTVTFNVKNISTGVYFYQIKAGEFSATKKLILTK